MIMNESRGNIKPSRKLRSEKPSRLRGARITDQGPMRSKRTTFTRISYLFKLLNCGPDFCYDNGFVRCFVAGLCGRILR